MASGQDQALDRALDAVELGWRMFAQMASDGDMSEAESWARFCFQMWEALDGVDSPTNGWSARAVLLLVAGVDHERAPVLWGDQRGGNEKSGMALPPP